MKSIREYRTRNRRSGFTLVEVLLVLGIIIVIMALVVPNFLGSQQEAMIKACRVKIKGVEKVSELYAVENNGFLLEGSTEEVYEKLMYPVDPVTGRERPPYMTELPIDPWGQPLRYEYSRSGGSGNRQTRGNKPSIWSAGPDGDDDTEDDVTNFISEEEKL